MHVGSLDKMKRFVDKYLHELNNERLRILDVGSQDVNGSYRQFFLNDKWEYVGCDMVAGKNVNIVLKNVYNWAEIESDSFDVLVSGQVFEHVEYFWVTILEIARVLKEGGLCCIIAPSGGFEHRYPVDCWRYYPDGFKAVAKYAGLNILEAYTQWQNVGYPDGSDIWKDSVLVCQKPSLSDSDRNAWRHKNILAKLIAGVSVKPSLLDEAVNFYKSLDRQENDLRILLDNIDQKRDLENSINQLNGFEIEDVITVINNEMTEKIPLLNIIASLNFQNGLYDNVIPYLNRALEIDEKSTDTLYNLGYVLHKIGENELACSYLNRIEPKDEQVIQLLKEIV